jgi:dTDP-4-amino-4,6-dideoxygalactose transaminase
VSRAESAAGGARTEGPDANPPIPQNSPLAAYLEQREAIDAAVRDVFTDGRYVLGDQVAAFEREFAAFTGVGFGVGVASGTDAVELALRALDIGAGSAVCVPAATAAGTIVGICRAGAVPVLVDVDPRTGLMSSDLLSETIRACYSLPNALKPRAVVPVHLYGGMADMSAIGGVAELHSLLVVEDCAQAHGAALGGRRAGSWGAAAAFSFYPTKNLGAFGDAGMVVTDSPAAAERLGRIREYGWGERFNSATFGVNSRLDELQAAVLRVKLHVLEEGNRRRAVIAAEYDHALIGTDITPLGILPGVKHVYHQYAVRSPKRDRLRETLLRLGVHSAVHYPLPIHQQNGFAGVAASIVPLPGAECLAREVLSLPLYPQMTEVAVQRVVDALRQAVEI